MHPFYFATEHNISALTPHKVFSSLLLLKPANFLDIRWQPLSLQTPVVCWLAYPALLSHLEFPIKKPKQTTYKSITDCTSVLFWNADYSNEELLECTLPGVLSSASTRSSLQFPTWKQHGMVSSPRTSAGCLWKAHWFRQQQKELSVPSCHAFM